MWIAIACAAYVYIMLCVAFLEFASKSDSADELLKYPATKTYWANVLKWMSSPIMVPCGILFCIFMMASDKLETWERK